ncbi:unnamed protein product [Rotaria sordida]|uniref:Uncharacterized protein n=1 Tax=Rotaria sordida TaxID=392033 RepID=A0A815S4W3_9BILA|nr:unnamed protein product [Rotaria sordida]
MQKISDSSKATLQTKAEYFRHSLAERIVDFILKTVNLICLIARTEYGLEELISKVVFKLLGSTNTEKTSLFNSLIDSDLRHIHVLGCIQRATESNLPGTTMNVLRFPTQLRTGKNRFINSIENETTT